MDTRIRDSPRHGGQRIFFLIFRHRTAAGASLRGRRHSSYLINERSHLRIIAEYYDFHRKCSKNPERSRMLTPTASARLKCDTTKTGNTPSSLSAQGIKKGDRYFPFSSFLCFFSYSDREILHDPIFFKHTFNKEHRRFFFIPLISDLPH